MTLPLPELEEEARKLGRTINKALPPGVGFAVILFDFGPSGNITYLSNGRREDMIRALRELLGNIEGH